MATSESDDFESADEELNTRGASVRKASAQRIKNIVDSDSDDDTEFIPSQSQASTQHTTYNPTKETKYEYNVSNLSKSNESKSAELKSNIAFKESKVKDDTEQKSVKTEILVQKEEKKVEIKSLSKVNIVKTQSELAKGKKTGEIKSGDTKKEESECTRYKVQRQNQPKQVCSFGAKRLGPVSKSSSVVSRSPTEFNLAEDVRANELTERNIPSAIQNSKILKQSSDIDSSEQSFTKKNTESELEEMPEELKSNLKFKDIFKPDEWEPFDKEVELPNTLEEENITPILNKLSSVSECHVEPNSSWGGWGSWNVGSLLNTATASVSTLTNRVSQGLTLLEETIGASDPVDLAKAETNQQRDLILTDESSEEPSESQSQSSFGFSNFISGVSSITKLFESTGSKVVTGGLDTLETIGKKTMEVIQEGDPGLKKKRGFFTNEVNKPILSQMLKEIKEKAPMEEKTFEERQAAKKICFESLFDDYQGLVHLEALKMLSKQSNMKIQHKMINLDSQELTSIQETLDEVKELCDLGENDEEGEAIEINLKDRFKVACQDLGVNVSFDKLNDVFQEVNSRISISTVSQGMSLSHQELFEQAISALAQFTAYSVERFHKTAELLLIKERRSTVSEADALVQLTRIVSGRISIIATLFCDKLNEIKKNSEMPDINSNITSIFLEAVNASSYVQDAFRLLIPVIQVGTI